MSSQVAAELRAAADVLERAGWCQGRSHIHIEDEHESADHWCAIGALREVVQDRSTPTRYGEAYRAFMVTLPCSPAVWNDRPGRTAEEVITALRAAADRAEAQS